MSYEGGISRNYVTAVCREKYNAVVARAMGRIPHDVGDAIQRLYSMTSLSGGYMHVFLEAMIVAGESASMNI